VPIENCQGKLAVEPVHAFGAPLFEGVQDNFRITVGDKCMSEGGQLLGQFRIVENFSVESDPIATRPGGHRLLTGFQIDDAQSGMSQKNTAIPPSSKFIRTTMAQSANHAFGSLFR